MNPYTPLFDNIAAQHGTVTAVVYGYIWRCCQMERGVCDASPSTIGTKIGSSRRTVIDHIDKLIAAGLVVDLTPDIKGKPHKLLVQDLHTTYAESAQVPMQKSHNTYADSAHKDTYTKGNKEESTAVTRTAKHFGEISGRTCTAEQYSKDWQPYLEKWVTKYGEDKARERIQKALHFAKGNNEQGKTYTISSPKSLDNILMNLNSNGHTNGINPPAVIPQATADELEEFERLINNAK